MKTYDFNQYKTRYRSAIRKVLSETEKGRLDEAAFPAYSHRNPVINWLFWQRLRTVMERLNGLVMYDRILDFGCGSGVMLPFLAGISRHVTAMDVDLFPLERTREQIPLAENVEVVNASQTTLNDLPKNAYDRIIALDVLEHVHDLPGTLTDLLALLKPDGQLIVSVPTENFLYQIGRKLAGPEYSGAYHERGAAEIKKEIGKLATLQPIATLYWPLPLFEIFSVNK